MSAWPTWEDNKSFSLGLLFLTALLCIFVGAKIVQTAVQTIRVDQPVPVEHSISVNGMGKITGAPDIATVSFGVQTKSATEAEAQTQNTTSMNTLLGDVKALGILDADIQTSDYQSAQNYTYDPVKQTQTADGWIVSQDVAVKVRDTTKVASVLQTLGQNGATNISGPSFGLDDPESLTNQARVKAVADAQTQAQALAQSLGVHLGKVVGYSESVDLPGAPQPIMFNAEPMAASAPATPPTVQSGSLDVTVNASITFDIE